jgi:hypothetical protein
MGFWDETLQVKMIKIGVYVRGRRMDENNVHLPSGRIVSKHGDPLPNGDLVVLFHDTNAYEVVKPDTIGSSSSLMHIYLAALMGENEDMGESASLIGMNVRVLKRGREDVVGEVVDVDAHKKQVSVEISGEGIVQLDAADVYVDFTQNLPVDLLKYIFKCINYPIATMGRLTRTNKQLKAKMNLHVSCKDTRSSKPFGRPGSASLLVK